MHNEGSCAPSSASLFFIWSHQSQRTAARAQQGITMAGYLAHTHTLTNLIMTSRQGIYTHTHPLSYHAYLPWGLHAACSALPRDVYPTSDILLAELACYNAPSILTRISRGRAAVRGCCREDDDRLSFRHYSCLKEAFIRVCPAVWWIWREDDSSVEQCFWPVLTATLSGLHSS